MYSFGEMPPRYTLKINPDGKKSLGRTFIDTSKAKKSNTEEEKYCMFCKKAGKPYDDHFMRKDNDPDGEIICKYLLSIKCEHCNDPGHTKKYCPYNKNSEYRLSSDNTKYIYVDKTGTSNTSNSKSHNTEYTHSTHSTDSTDDSNNSLDNSFTESVCGSGLGLESGFGLGLGSGLGSGFESKSTNKSNSKFCQFCEKNNVPKSICQNHDMFETLDGIVSLSCPLFYYLNNKKNDCEKDKSILSEPKLSDEPVISPKNKNKNMLTNNKDSPFIPFSSQKEKSVFNELNLSIESIGTIKSNVSSLSRASVESNDSVESVEESNDLKNMIKNLKRIDKNLSNELSNSFDSSFNDSVDGSINDSYTDNENSSNSNVFDSNEKLNTNQNNCYNYQYNPYYPYYPYYPNYPNYPNYQNYQNYPNYPNYQNYPNGYFNMLGQPVQPIQPVQPAQTVHSNNMQSNNIQSNNIQSNNMQSNNVIKTRTVTSTYYSPSPSPSPSVSGV